MWIILIGIHTCLLVFSKQISLSIAFVDALVSNTLYGSIGLGLWYPVFYGRLDDEKLMGIIVSNLLGCVLAVGFWLGTSYLLLGSLYHTHATYLSFLRFSLPWRAGIGLLYYEVIILLYYLIVYYRNNKRNQIQEAELKTLVKESELNSLKAQINPHFLFNSLNSISALTMIEPGKAQEMIIKLSDFLRYTTSNKEENFTTLEQEINNVNRYLDIEKIRFGSRLHIIQNISESYYSLHLPGLILQPLVENAIKYGIYENTHESVIELKCSYHANFLSITVTNELLPDCVKSKGEGVGLHNIQSRMRILYNRDDLINVSKANHQFEVTLKFPQIESLWNSSRH